MKSLSPTMQTALSIIQLSRGKEIRRFPGGTWYVTDPVGVADTFGTQTVHAMVARGVLVWSDWKENSRGRFPVAARVSEEIL